jgi:hypothetical protein
MSPLRRRMIEDMQIRNLTPNTQRVYVAQVVHWRYRVPEPQRTIRRPETLDEPHHLSQSTCVAAMAWWDKPFSKLRYLAVVSS